MLGELTKCSTYWDKNLSLLLEKEPKKPHLMTLLHPIKYQWYIIGVQLEVSHGDVESIHNEANDDSVKLAKVLQKWIDKNQQVCWRKIISVVEEAPIENQNVANEIYEFLSRPDIQNEYLPLDQSGKV